jgi:cytochrome c-type biogenesis protein CcmH/NrfF
MTMPRLLAIIVAFFVTACPAFAVTPDEVLPNAALEARARSISAELRCMICQNQSIDDSDAELARDLRVLVRQRLLAGDSDAQVLDYVVSRYGEFVLLRPRVNWRNALLWGTPVLLLLVGGSYILVASRRRRTLETPALTDTERQALDEMLGKDA